MVVKYVVSDSVSTAAQPTMTLVQPVEQYHSDYDFAVSYYIAKRQPITDNDTIVL